jgi:hypothetical protein
MFCNKKKFCQEPQLWNIYVLFQLFLFSCVLVVCIKLIRKQRALCGIILFILQYKNLLALS